MNNLYFANLLPHMAEVSGLCILPGTSEMDRFNLHDWPASTNISHVSQTWSGDDPETHGNDSGNKTVDRVEVHFRLGHGRGCRLRGVLLYHGEDQHVIQRMKYNWKVILSQQGIPPDYQNMSLSDLDGMRRGFMQRLRDREVGEGEGEGEGRVRRYGDVGVNALNLRNSSVIGRSTVANVMEEDRGGRHRMGRPVTDEDHDDCRGMVEKMLWESGRSIRWVKDPTWRRAAERASQRLNGESGRGRRNQTQI